MNTPNLDALLKEVEEMDDHDSVAPRLAAMLRVAVEALQGVMKGHDQAEMFGRAWDGMEAIERIAGGGQ